MRTLIILLFSLVFMKHAEAQNINILNLAGKKTAENIYEKIKDFNNINIIVLPIYNINGNITENSDIIGKIIASELNLICDETVNVWYYTDFDNNELIEEINKAEIKQRDSKFYEKVIQKFKPDLLIKGDYCINNFRNTFCVQNITIYTNWYDNDTPKIISAPPAIVNMGTVNMKKYIIRSVILPGWGQRTKYNDNRSWGYSYLYLGSLSFSTSTFFISNYYYNLANKTSNSLDKQRFMRLSDFNSTLSFIGVSAAVGVNIFNIFSLLSSDDRQVVDNRLFIKPQFCQYNHSCQISVTIKF